jgi:transglutaminase-like putative cysteine protease
MPTDGIVKSTAALAVKDAKTDAEKARALYDWIVDNTFRNPKTRGCGIGDVRSMLETKDLGGKCADLNALYVALARSSGLPARDVYGIRTAKSELGYKSLGASSETVTKSQHCRAEVYLAGYGWVPVDPADVRKVVLEEPPGNRPMDDEMVARRAALRLLGDELDWRTTSRTTWRFGLDRPGARSSCTAGQTADGRLDPWTDGFKYEVLEGVTALTAPLPPRRQVPLLRGERDYFVLRFSLDVGAMGAP